jgi:hypothetical protein
MHFDTLSNEIKFINYSRKEALIEKAIIPTTFYSIDGPVSWLDEEERLTKVELLSEASRDDMRKALVSALHTQIGEAVLLQALENFQAWLEVNHTSKMLIVVSSIEQAHYWNNYLLDKGVNAPVATSDEATLAEERIAQFKSHPQCKFLITVGMAYEGLDVPEISHIAVMNKIRSKPWLEQCFARATRYDYKSSFLDSSVEQRAHIFFPKDPLMIEVAKSIGKEQLSAASDISDSIPIGGKSVADSNSAEIIPLSSEVKYTDQFNFDMEMEQIPSNASKTKSNVIPIPISSRQQADALRKTIDRKTKRIAHDLKQDFRAFNSELKKRFGKSRTEMTIIELNAVNSYLDEIVGLTMEGL